MALDEEIRKELTELVGSAITAATRAQNERFVTGDRLCEIYQMFTKSWLKTYGHLLPRCRVRMCDEDTGELSNTKRWAYNVAAIQKMIDHNNLAFMIKPKNECIYRPSKTKNL